MIGGANVDYVARATGTASPGVSNPASIARAPGGVALNICLALAAKGRTPSLVSRIGADADGDHLLASLEAVGVERSAIHRPSDAATGRYLAIEDANGALLVGAADTRIIDDWPTDQFDAALKDVEANRFWVLDMNLPKTLLERAAIAGGRCGAGLIVDAVSAAKAGRCRVINTSIDTFFCNILEARALGAAGDGAQLAQALAASLPHVETIILTAGSAPMHLVSNGRTTAIDVDPIDTRGTSTTGAGDALIAGYVDARLAGKTHEQSLIAGSADARTKILSSRM